MVCPSQWLGLDLIFDTEHLAFECKSILIVPLSDRVKRNLQGICTHAFVSKRAGFRDTYKMMEGIIRIDYITHRITVSRCFFY